MNELREKRKQLGLTQIEAARACGVSRRTYQTYEEQQIMNATYEELCKRLEDGDNFISSLKYIKRICGEVFTTMYPEVKAAYLFGSYARGEATGKSDIDILVVCPPMGMKFYGIAAELEEQLHKQIDLQTHRQLAKKEKFLEQILKEGIKIYG